MPWSAGDTPRDRTVTQWGLRRARLLRMAVTSTPARPSRSTSRRCLHEERCNSRSVESVLKKAGMIAGVAAGLMIVGSPAFAGTPNDLVMSDGGDTQVTHYVPIQIVDNHVPVSSEEYVDGGSSHTNASNVLGGGGD